MQMFSVDVMQCLLFMFGEAFSTRDARVLVALMIASALTYR
jgi:hypothetical protein